MTLRTGLSRRVLGLSAAPPHCPRPHSLWQQWRNFTCLLHASSFTRLRFTPDVKRAIATGAYHPGRTRPYSLLAAAELGPPPVTPRWFHATDVPVFVPERYEYHSTGTAEKFVEFGPDDSKRLEEAFRKGSTDPVYVKEDLLFAVDPSKLTMLPVYWDGAVYEVRRATWYGDNGMPVTPALAESLEQGYCELKPYLFQREDTRGERGETARQPAPKGALVAARQLVASERDLYCLDDEAQLVVLYVDGSHALLLPDALQGSFQLALLRELQLPPIPGITKVTRGLPRDKREEQASEEDGGLLSSFSPETLVRQFEREVLEMFGNELRMGDAVHSSRDTTAEEERGAMQQQMEQDYNTPAPNHRGVDHLVLCVHGIGQVLGAKYELIDFTHSINVMRRTLKDVYEKETRFHGLGVDQNDAAMHKERETNCRVQVLPILWRHRVDFPTHRAMDIKDASGLARFPLLGGILPDGVMSLRNVASDVLLDVLLYYEPLYNQQIMEAVVSEMNRVYTVFRQLNPEFKGKVSVLGHLLGLAIVFDVLKNQPDTVPSGADADANKHLQFEVDNFFALGLPVGVFQLLRRSQIRTRRSPLPPTMRAEDVARLRVKNIYNIFHPCDPVGYRMEPLISPRFAQYRAEPVAFALSSSVNLHFQKWAHVGEELTLKVADVALNVFSFFGLKVARGLNLEPLMHKMASDTAGEQARHEQDVAAGQLGVREVPMPARELALITECNRTGRVDYLLPMGLFDILLVLAVGAHVSYFEDDNTAGFLLQELLTKQERVGEKKVRVA